MTIGIQENKKNIYTCCKTAIRQLQDEPIRQCIVLNLYQYIDKFVLRRHDHHHCAASLLSKHK